MGLAHEPGWRLRIEGHGTWLSRRRPRRPRAQHPRARSRRVREPRRPRRRRAGGHPAGDAPPPAGRRRDVARARPARPARAQHRAPCSPPARRARCRQGFGPVRDHVLGLTVVTGDGPRRAPGRAGGEERRGVRPHQAAGGRLRRRSASSPSCALRLRAVPRADRTLLARGPRDHLTALARDLTAARLEPERARALLPRHRRRAATGCSPRACSAPTRAWPPRRGGSRPRATCRGRHSRIERASSFWHLAARAVLGGPVTLRLGVLQDGLDDTLDLRGRRPRRGTRRRRAPAAPAASAGAATPASPPCARSAAPRPPARSR